MPQTQTAQVALYDFGAPAGALAEVLKFRARKGGKLDLKLENPGVEAFNASVQVSADGTTWAATTAANNGTAVTNLAVPAKQSKEATINLRDGQDNFVRVLANGGVRGQIQIRPDSLLEIVSI